MEMSPVFGLGDSQFWMASRSMPVTLFVLNPFLVMTHFSRQYKTTKKIFHCFSNVWMSSLTALPET